MTTVIHYFSGTGNSLLVARKLAQRLGDAAVRPLGDLLESGGGDALDDADVIGFVFPVYFDRMPEIVRRAVSAYSPHDDPYIFAVSTSGATTGNALCDVDSLLALAGARLAYGANIALADNSIILETPQAEIDRRMGGLDEFADEVADAVRGRLGNDFSAGRKTSQALMGKVNKAGFVHLYRAENRVVHGVRCTRCGTCVKVCPVGNISMSEGDVVIGDRCEWCFACLNWCPHQAIRFGRIDPASKKQYRCLGMKASDLYVKGASERDAG